MAEFPALIVTPRPVPDQENGFLQLHLLANSDEGLPVSSEIYSLLSEPNGWNAKAAARLLEEHSELVNRIEHIAALPRHSSSNMPDDFDGFIRARNGKTSSDILLIKARLAAEAGDEAETLRLVAAVQNICSHYREVESPNFLGETVTVLVDLSIHGVAFDSLLPSFGPKANLPRWKAVLGARTYTPADFAHVLRGEWNTAADFFGFRFLLVGQRDHQLPDAEAVAKAYASWANECVSKLHSAELRNLESCLALPNSVLELSKEGQQFMDELWEGNGAWAKGYTRAAVILARHQAALDLLILEKDGATLTAQDADRVTRDPVSGLPFVFDPAQRTLAVPPGSLEQEEKPLALPW